MYRLPILYHSNLKIHLSNTPPLCKEEPVAHYRSQYFSELVDKNSTHAPTIDIAITVKITCVIQPV